ncbi:MAG TPA: hypothetical protein VGC47_04220 [Acidimicrobiia bacterium]|jgi:hypothetical protein
MVFSYFSYGYAFAAPEDEVVRINVGLIAIALTIAPFVFVVLAFVSRNPRAPGMVLRAMGLLLLVGLSVGLLSPALGASAAFGAGGAITLNPLPLDRVYRRRVWAVVVSTIYTLVLLVVATPAGVFTGGLLPLLMLGFADEYTAWRAGQEAG